MINVIEVPDPDTIQDPIEFGLIFPIPGQEKNTVVMEPRDGNTVQRLTATAVEFKANGRTAFRDRKIKIDLFLTDARLALACSKYDKGGGWIGGAGTMIVFNSVSKARAALRSRGKMLVGQVRYPWIRRVGSSPKTGWTSDEKLIFDTLAASGAMRLILRLPKNVDSGLVASEVMRRAVRYRLVVETPGGEVGAILEQFASSLPVPTEQDGVRFYNSPEPHVVGEDSARLAPRATA